MTPQRLLVVAALLASFPLLAAGVAPGTRITNTVQVVYMVDGVAHTASADSAVTVDQLIEATATWQDNGAVPATAGDRQALLFKITNNSNGHDSFRLAVAPANGGTAGFTAADCRLYLDADDDGVHSAADPLYVAGDNDPSLAAGASTDVLAVCRIPDRARDGAQGRVRVTATSNTFSGDPGAVHALAAIPGAEAVLGPSGGVAVADGRYLAGNVAYAFNATQKITDPSGGEQPVSGAVIQYTLTVIPSGSATGSNVVLTDPTPEHTAYVAGSLTLNGASLGDGASDGDVGDYNVTHPGAITVAFGDLPGSAGAQVVSFKVRIK